MKLVHQTSAFMSACTSGAVSMVEPAVPDYLDIACVPASDAM